MQITTLLISDLIPYSNNAKEHPQEQIEQIKSSILKFGNNDPIAVDENNVIIEGHGRYQALKELGVAEAECIVLSGLTENEKNAYRIVHNQLTMNTDWDIEKLKAELQSITGIDMAELGIDESMLDEFENDVEEDTDFDIEEALEEIEEPKSKPGDVYQLGNHRLMCGSSTNSNDVKKLMQGNMADLLVTDPPYNVNVSNSKDMTILNDNMSDADFKKFIFAAMKCASEVLKEGAAFYIWYGDSEDINFRTACFDNKLTIKQCLIWVKNSFTLGRQDYQWKHEPCLYGWKEGAAHYFVDDRTFDTVIEDKPDIDRMTKEELKAYIVDLLSNEPATTIIKENKPTKNSEHPTMKPLKLIGKLVKNSSKKNETVLDLFGGSGSTLIACEQLDRVCYTMELDPKYCDVIVKRWEEYTGNEAKVL